MSDTLTQRLTHHMTLPCLHTSCFCMHACKYAFRFPVLAHLIILPAGQCLMTAPLTCTP